VTVFRAIVFSQFSGVSRCRSSRPMLRNALKKVSAVRSSATAWLPTLR